MSIVNFLEDPNLSLKAKGIMAYLCSLPEKKATIKELISAGPEGRDSILSGIKELVSHGYVLKHKSKTGYVYLINTQSKHVHVTEVF